MTADDFIPIRPTAETLAARGAFRQPPGFVIDANSEKGCLLEFARDPKAFDRAPASDTRDYSSVKLGAKPGSASDGSRLDVEWRDQGLRDNTFDRTFYTFDNDVRSSNGERLYFRVP